MIKTSCLGLVIVFMLVSAWAVQYVATVPMTGTAATPPLANLQLWYSADCITYSGGNCSTPADGTNVTNWNDRSGNANNATTANTCTFHTNQINGQPAVTFNGACNLDFTSVAATNVTAIFVVYKRTSGTVGTILSGNSSSFGYRTAVNGKQQDMLKILVADGLQGTAAQDTNWHQIYGVNCNGSCTDGPPYQIFHLDRNADGTSNSGLGIASGALHIGSDAGSSEFLNGQIAEILFYTNNGTSISGTVNPTTVETYLHNKYGL